MTQIITLQIKPEDAANDALINLQIAKALFANVNDITGFHILKKSVDARSRQIWINLQLQVFINEKVAERSLPIFEFKDVSQAQKSVIIIGSGPAGLFAALQLIEKGIRPIILERGKNVRTRRRDLAAINKQGIMNPDSNYCFGEGGAGTYSDGKLYTRSNKRGNIDRILALFVQFGADEKILYEAHPHIGTNKLPHIITAIREQILACGGAVHFEKKVTSFVLKDDRIHEVITQDGTRFHGDQVILATGHSARDIFIMLHEQGIFIEAKPFALGVRAEHPQALIDQIQYKRPDRGDYLPPASYSLVTQVNDLGVFSFCMCPGGIIAPAATAADEIVVNGWSPSKRDNPFANSGIVVQVQEADVMKETAFIQTHQKAIGTPLMMMRFQEWVEQKAFAAGGGSLVAPAQRMVDFSTNKSSNSLPDCSYLPGVNAVDLKTVLPSFVQKSLQEGFKAFGKKMKGYYTNEALLVATESRTSSPIRIPREKEPLHHPQIKNLYPCGEGAGYAGGIVSAAMDGERVALKIAAG